MICLILQQPTLGPSTREYATLRNGISRILGKNNLSSRKQIGIEDSPVKTFFPNWVILIIHNEPLHLTAKSIYATFTSYPMKRVSKFHSVPCILTLAQQLYSVIHRGHIYIYVYRRAFDDIALSSIFVQQYVVNGNKSSRRAIIQISTRYGSRRKDKKKYNFHDDASSEIRLENSNCTSCSSNIQTTTRTDFNVVDVCPS